MALIADHHARVAEPLSQLIGAGRCDGVADDQNALAPFDRGLAGGEDRADVVVHAEVLLRLVQPHRQGDRRSDDQYTHVSYYLGVYLRHTFEGGHGLAGTHSEEQALGAIAVRQKGGASGLVGE